MKKLIFVLIILAIAASLFSPVKASDELSGAIDILRHKASLIKSSSTDGEVMFAPEDFDKAFGLGKVEFIIITRLPDSSEGILKLGGNDILVGQGISRNNIPLIEFLPINSEIKSSSFTFKCYGKEMDCIIDLEKGATLEPPKAKSSSEMTYKNLSVTGLLKTEKADSITIVSAPKHGFLTLNDSGAFTYFPDDGYTGNDSFSYTAANSNTNSDKATVKLRILDSGNIFFDDIKEAGQQRAAISLALKGAVSYTSNDELMNCSADSIPKRADFAESAAKLFDIGDLGSLQCFSDNDASASICALYNNGIFPAELTDRGRESGGGLNLSSDFALTVCENLLVSDYPEICIQSRLYNTSAESVEISRAQAYEYLALTEEIKDGYGNIDYFFNKYY